MLVHQKIIWILRRLDSVVGSGTAGINANRSINRIANGTNLGNSNMALKDFLDAVMYDTYDPVINSFTGGSTLEKGETSLTKTLSYNVSAPDGGTISSIVITSNEGYDSGDIKSGTGDQSGTHDVTLTSDTNETFTITVTSDDSKTTTSTTSFVFRNKTYYGAATPATLNETFIKALTGQFDANYSTEFTVNAGSGEHIYYAVPKDYVSSPYIDPPYFYVGGFAGGFEIAAETVSYTYGTNTEDYIIFRSVNPNLGNTSVTVQST